MDRTPPAAASEEIELYIRTYYSVLRSTAPVRLRSLEETHAGMNSHLHFKANSPDPDITALMYSALRLPPCFPDVSLVLMGQMEDVFRRKGYPDVERWQPVKARARRRKLYYDPERRILAAFIASVTDIDDMIPSMVAYQIEWNKLHDKLNMHRLRNELSRMNHDEDGAFSLELMHALQEALGISSDDFRKLTQVWPGKQLAQNLQKVAEKRLDIRVNVLGGGLSDYRRAVQHWWQRLEQIEPVELTERPIYFVSSNTHSLTNLLSGFAWSHQDEIINFVLQENPENLADEYRRIYREDMNQFGNFLYYTSRLYLSHPAYRDKVRPSALEQEKQAGIVRVSNPHCLDVEAEIAVMSELNWEWMDPRLGDFTPEERALLAKSNALIFNIDYPLGMAAYHVLSQVSTAASELLGVYILGKAATLNGRVGDVMIPNVVYDEHSRNTFLFRNCFSAEDVGSYLNYGTVFDNQKSVTVRGTFLQNREFMHVFYEEGYTDIEMEAGPYLSAMYENIYPKRYPVDEIVNLFINAPYDIGILHYASDTPISRRQTLLSKSMSYFGVDATYATTIAVLRRILQQEIRRQARLTSAAAPRDLSGVVEAEV
jgi:hypothetical protein